MSSASAGELVADAVPLRTLVEAAAKPYGLKVNVCSAADRLVSGRFDFRDAGSIAGLLMEKGYPVSFDGMALQVGCDQSSIETPLMGGAFGSSIPRGNPLDPNMTSGASSYAPVAPPPPLSFERATAKYRDPSKLLAVLSKLPGLSVIADPEIPGPMLLAGPASIVKQAAAFMADLDRCPDQVEIEAIVVTSGEASDRSRAFGVQLRASSSDLAGTFDPGSAALITIPGLRAFLDASRESSNVRQNSTFKGQVMVGHSVVMGDGNEIAIRAATSVTDRETRADVAYRQIGHRITVKLEALSDWAVVTVNHELSSVSGQSTLGPSFATRSTVTTMRVRLDQPTMIALAGTDLAQKTQSKGIFSRGDSTTTNRQGSYLVFAVRRVGCSVAGDALPLAPIAKLPTAAGDAKSARSKRRVRKAGATTDATDATTPSTDREAGNL